MHIIKITYVAYVILAPPVCRKRRNKKKKNNNWREIKTEIVTSFETDWGDEKQTEFVLSL